jgi:hypothetical protein
LITKEALCLIHITIIAQKPGIICIMKITKFPGNILYIEDAFPQAQEFIDNIEKFNEDPITHSVIPPWQDWIDGRPSNPTSDKTHWDFKLDSYTKGKQKLFDYDISLNNENTVWPRRSYEFMDEAHRTVQDTIDMIDKPYNEILKVWAEETGNSPLEYVSKNYFLRKYHTGGAIGPHIDKNHENPLNTMDWSILFYLNDNYKGGEVSFPELGVTIKPSAGSALVFPCTATHLAETVEDGEKYYIFMVIHSEFGHSTALREPYHRLNEAILKHKGITDHIILDLQSN